MGITTRLAKEKVFRGTSSSARPEDRPAQVPCPIFLASFACRAILGSSPRMTGRVSDRVQQGGGVVADVVHRRADPPRAEFGGRRAHGGVCGQCGDAGRCLRGRRRGDVLLGQQPDEFRPMFGNRRPQLPAPVWRQGVWGQRGIERTRRGFPGAIVQKQPAQARRNGNGITVSGRQFVHSDASAAQSEVSCAAVSVE